MAWTRPARAELRYTALHGTQGRPREPHHRAGAVDHQRLRGVRVERTHRLVQLLQLLPLRVDLLPLPEAPLLGVLFQTLELRGGVLALLLDLLPHRPDLLPLRLHGSEKPPEARLDQRVILNRPN